MITTTNLNSKDSESTAAVIASDSYYPHQIIHQKHRSYYSKYLKMTEDESTPRRRNNFAIKEMGERE